VQPVVEIGGKGKGRTQFKDVTYDAEPAALQELLDRHVKQRREFSGHISC
jgi:hypothetical protein